jgi:hypothetical protein
MKNSELKECVNCNPDDESVNIICVNPRKRKLYKLENVIDMTGQGHNVIIIDIGAEVDMDADMVKACEECERDAVNQAWTTVEEELPPPDKCLLLSLENYPVPMIGRYIVNGDEDGTFMIGSSQESFLQNDLYVNAWMELPVPYNTGNDLERYRAAITKDFMKKARR